MGTEAPSVTGTSHSTRSIIRSGWAGGGPQVRVGQRLVRSWGFLACPCFPYLFENVLPLPMLSPLHALRPIPVVKTPSPKRYMFFVNVNQTYDGYRTGVGRRLSNALPIGTEQPRAHQKWRGTALHSPTLPHSSTSVPPVVRLTPVVHFSAPQLSPRFTGSEFRQCGRRAIGRRADRAAPHRRSSFHFLQQAIFIAQCSPNCSSLLLC